MDELEELVRVIRLSFTVEEDDRTDRNVVDALDNVAHHLDRLARAINQQGPN